MINDRSVGLLLIVEWGIVWPCSVTFEFCNLIATYEMVIIEVNIC